MYEGWLGALIMRQGYYVANGKKLLSWIEERVQGSPAFTRPSTTSGICGKPAPRDLPGITGKVGDIKKGQVRDGGSFVKRSCKYTVWNSFYEENVYQVKKFNEFLSA